MARRMTEDAVKQAQIALKNFRALQPTLNQYARMLTGRPDVRVVASEHDNGSTDGKQINYRPPISLGKVLNHERWNCDRRDEFQILRCPACAQREDVLTTIYHEIAHIWFNSFSGLTDDAKEKAIRAAVASLGTKYGEKVRETVGKMGSRLGYMGLARLVSPFLSPLLNALEDARVNRELFRAMPGTKVMFDANTAKVFREGVEQVNEKTGEWERDLWRERSLNSQGLIAIFCMASGYDFSEWLAEFVVKMLADEELVGIVRQLDDITSIDSTFSLAFPILARMRELGFFRDEADPPDDFVPPYDEELEEPEDESDPGEGGKGGDSGDESGDEPGDESGDEPADESGGDDDSEAAGSGDDPSRPDGDGDGDDAGESDGPSDSSVEPEGGIDEDRGDSLDGGSAGLEDDGTESGEEGDDGTGAGDPGADSDEGSPDEAADEVPEEDPDRGESESGTVPESGDSADIRDGDRSEDEGLVGPDSPDSGDADSGELGGDDDSAGGAESLGDVDPLEDNPAGRVDEDGDDSLIDTGAHKKSVRIDGEITRPLKPPLPWGDAESVDISVHELGEHEAPTSVHMHDGEEHEHDHGHRSEEDEAGDAIVKAVMLSGIYFEMPSVHVTDVKFHTEKDDYFARSYARMDARNRKRLGLDGEIMPPSSVLNPVVSRARVVFADNFRGRHETGLRRGRIHSPSLAMKAPVGDDTMFRQKRLPGRQDYFVGIGIDASGSTAGINIDLAKKVACAEAELLSRLGIPFFMYAHSGTLDYDTGAYQLDMIEIKRSDEVWNDQTRARLKGLGPVMANLDGHTIQLYRKFLEKEKATTKILHYYSDGAMPCENYREERQILLDEIKTYKHKGLILRGVGIRDDAPKQYGLPTVVVEEQKDIMAVVVDLEEQLTKRR